MPDLSSIQPVLRAGGYNFAGYLCTPIERVVFSRAVNMPSSVPDQALTLTFDDAYSGAGAYTDVQEDMEIVVHVGNTDAIRGRLRVAPGAATSTVLQINEVSHGRIDIHDNDRIDVLDSYRLRDRLIAANKTFDKDSRIPYSNQGTDHPPTIVSGPGAAAFVDPITGLLTVVFDFSGSYPNDTDNASGVALLSDVADGTITVGTDTDAVFTATFPVGFRWVTIVCADADNGEVTVRKLPVWAFDGVTYSPIPIMKYTGTLDKKAGDSATFQLASDCDLSSLPEGALLYYFEREFYNGVEVSYGNQVADRSNIKFVGFARRETITIDPDNDTLTFEAISPIQKQNELPAFTQDLIMAAMPADWQHDEWVSVPKKLAFYVSFWHSTSSVLFDLCFQGSATGDYIYPSFFTQAATLRGQMDEATAGVSMAYTCDRTGRFIIARNLQRGNVSERNTAAPVTLALTRRDLREITSLIWEHSYQYNQLEAKGFNGNGTPLKAIAGGEAPAEAPDLTTFERAIVSAGSAEGQTELIDIASDAFAEVNSLYNGLGVPKGIPFKMPTSYDVVDPAYPEWISATLPETSNRRRRSFAADRFIVQRIEIEADAVTGTKSLTWTVDHETKGQGAVARSVDTSVYVPPILTPLPPSNPTSVVPGNSLGRRMANLALPNADGGIYYTNTATSPSPLFGRDFDLVAAGMAGTLRDFTVNAYSPGYKSPPTGPQVNGWIASSLEVRALTDIFDATALGTPTTFSPVPTSTVIMDFERAVPNWGIVAYYSSGSGVHVYFTVDGVTWTAGTGLPAHWDTTANQFPPGLYLNPHVAGEAYVSAYTTTSATPSVGLYKTSDYGATWTLVGTPAVDPGIGLAVCLVVPYTNGGDMMFYGKTVSSSVIQLMRVTGAGVPVDVSPSYGGDKYAPVVRNRALSISPTNPSVGVLCGWNNYGGTESGGVFRTRNLLGTPPTWSTVVVPTPSFGIWRRAYVAGDDPEYTFLLGAGGKFGVIIGNSFADRSGNMAIDYLSADEFVGLCGKGS